MNATTQRTDTIEHTIGPSGSFRLDVRSSEVRVLAVDGDAVRIRARDRSSLSRLDVQAADRDLSVRASGGAPDLVVEVPTGASVTVEGSGSDLQVEGLRGDQRYRTASGDIHLRDVGGQLIIEAVSGDVDIVAGAPTTVAARTVSGDLSLRAGPIQALRAVTTSGDVRIAGRFDGEGPFAIETVSGDATIAPAEGLRIRTSTVTGDVRTEGDARAEGQRGQRTVIVGAGRPEMTFRSTSGDLRVVRALPLAAPVRPTVPPPPAPPEAPALVASTVSSDPDPDAESRLDILRALERGEIDVAEATLRLEALEIDADAPDEPATDESDHAG